jgi:hypothetical protein
VDLAADLYSTSTDRESSMRRPLMDQEHAAEEPAPRVGRPTKIDPELGCEIEALVAKGLPLREVAARVGVHPRTILRRAASDPEFGARYARARALALEALFTELENLARCGDSKRDVSRARQQLMRRAPKRHGRPEEDRYTIGGPGHRLVRTLALRSMSR